MVWILFAASLLIVLLLVVLITRLFKLPDEPKTLAEARPQIRTLWRMFRLALVGLLVVAVLAPVLAVYVFDLGRRGRDNVCEVTEGTFDGYSDGLVTILASVSDTPATDEEQTERDGKVAALRGGLHDLVGDLMSECNQ